MMGEIMGTSVYCGAVDLPLHRPSCERYAGQERRKSVAVFKLSWAVGHCH